MLDYVASLMTQRTAGRSATSAQPDAPEQVVAASARPSHTATLRRHAGHALRRVVETLDPPVGPATAPLETC